MQESLNNLKNMKYAYLILFLTYSTIYAQIKNEKGVIELNNKTIVSGTISYENDLLTIKTENKELKSFQSKEVEYIKLNDGRVFNFIDIQIDINKFIKNRNCSDQSAQLKKITLLCNVLLSGKISLYKSVFQSDILYIVEHNNSYHPLINSKCSKGEDRLNKKNEEFKKTLNDLFQDKNYELNDFLSLQFNDKSLSNFIKEINQNDHSNFDDYTNIKDPQSFFIAPYIGYRFQSYRVDLINRIDFSDNFNNLNFGVDLSYYFNTKRTFAGYFRGNFEKIDIEESKSKVNNDLSIPRYNHEKVIMSANLLTLSFGPRMSIYEKQNFKIAVDLSADFNIPVGNSNYSYYRTLTLESSHTFSENELLFSKPIETTISYSGGISTTFMKKYTFEFRYYTERDLGAMDSTGRTLTPFLNKSVGFNLMYVF